MAGLFWNYPVSTREADSYFDETPKLPAPCVCDWNTPLITTLFMGNNTRYDARLK